MPIHTYVTTIDTNEATGITTDEKTILTTLAPSDNAVAVRLQELFGSIAESISASLEVESTLTIEITGSLNLKAQGGVKYLFFNVGAEAATSGTLKVVLSTTLKPKAEIKQMGKSRQTKIS